MVENLTESEIFERLWAKYGRDAQLDILIEECSELIHAIIKERRKGIRYSHNMLEELVDVDICVRQVMGDAKRENDGLIEIVRSNKMDRLSKMI